MSKENFKNITIKERNVYSKNDKSIITKSPDKRSVVVPWDKQSYIKKL